MKKRIVLICLVALTGLPPAAKSLDVVHPNYFVFNEFALPAGLTLSLGDLAFSDDGNTAYFIDESEDPGSTVWMAPVTRDAAGNVTAFGTMTAVFSDGGIDTGLAFGPGTGTFFYRRVSDGIVQRLTSGVIEPRDINNYDDEFGGLAFFPPIYSNGGDIVSSSYTDGTIYRHPASPDGDGSFTISDGVLYADLSTSVGVEIIGDIEFITSGPLANSLMIAIYFSGGVDLVTIGLNPVTGLPAEGSKPTVQTFATDTNEEAWGVAVDPVTNNIWLVNWNASTPQLAQIRLRAPQVPALGLAGRVLLFAALALVSCLYPSRMR